MNCIMTKQDTPRLLSIAKEWKWLIACGLISILIIGLMTDFKFNDRDVQIFDTYYVVNPLRIFIFLTLILWTTKNFYMLVNLMTGRYRVIALIVSIVNPLVGLFAFILFYMGLTAGIIAYGIFALLIAVPIMIEIRTLRKLRIHLNNDRS
jgi:hypothetical protein